MTGTYVVWIVCKMRLHFRSWWCRGRFSRTKRNIVDCHNAWVRRCTCWPMTRNVMLHRAVTSSYVIITLRWRYKTQPVSHCTKCKLITTKVRLTHYKHHLIIIITRNPKVIWEEPCRLSTFFLYVAFPQNLPLPMWESNKLAATLPHAYTTTQLQLHSRRRECWPYWSRGV